jgi:hypothetical protein
VRSNCLQMIDETPVLKIKIQFLGAMVRLFFHKHTRFHSQAPVLRGEQTRSDPESPIP